MFLTERPAFARNYTTRSRRLSSITRAPCRNVDQGARATRCYRLGLLENTKVQSSMSWLGRSFIFTALRISQMSMPCRLADLMMQFLTYFWRFRQCHLNFMPFASSLHAAVAFSRATLSALDSFAASAGVGTNAMPLTSTVAIIPANEAVAK